MLSRVANSIYWMSRYLERAENVARFVDVNQNLLLDFGASDVTQWEPLVSITGDASWFKARYGEASAENVLRFLTFDTNYHNSVISCLENARENARTIRECLSAPLWEELNKFYWWVRDAAQTGVPLHQQFDFYNHIKLAHHQLLGVMSATWSRNDGWHFARVGRRTERADKTSRILDVKYFILLPEVQDVGTPLDVVQWAALLKSCNALEMYRQCHGRITPKQVVDFLIFDRVFPRSLLSCLLGAEDSLLAITGSREGTFSNPAEQAMGRLRSELSYSQIDEVIGGGLHEFVDRFQRKLNGVGDAIHLTFFERDV